MASDRLQWQHRHSWLLVAYGASGASGYRYEVQRLGPDKWLATKFDTHKAFLGKTVERGPLGAVKRAAAKEEARLLGAQRERAKVSA